MPPTLLACPGCGRLVYADSLKSAVAEASAAEAAGDLTAALTGWRQALGLLPPETVQHQRVAAEVKRLSDRVGALPAAAGAPRAGRRAGVIGALAAAAAVVAKLKWAILFLLGKGKLLFFGLLKAKTLLSMVLSMGVYASAFGWPFAVGLILSIYVHEMGHVASLRRYGIPASAPMFIPGFGAFVRLKQHPATPGEDARVGLAGPVWGAAAAVACLLAATVSGAPIFFALARAGAWINLFNLAPIWQLDGGRGFSALSQRQRVVVAVGWWLLALISRDGLVFLLAIASTARAAGRNAPPAGDRPVLATYLTLAIGLTIMVATLPGPHQLR
jgi:Zn-dependent protease